MNYYVEAESRIGELAEDIEAQDLNELVQFTRETFAYMNGCHDTSDVDVSWIKFKFTKVEDEDGEDITDEANEHIW